MTTLPITKTLELDLEAGWLTIWFNRPDQRNALSNELAGEVIEVLETIQSDRSIRGVTLRGRGGIFCAGGDLKGFKAFGEAGGNAREVVLEASRNAARLFRLVHDIPQITVSIVEGAAMAGGFGIACASDILITTEDARFALTETRIGLSPAQITPYIVEKLGFSAGRRMMLLGTMINGIDAKELGMADFLATDTDGLSAHEEYVKKQTMNCAPEAVGITKEVINAYKQQEPAEFVEYAADCFADCLLGEEGQEGFSSFLEKRKPSWAPMKNKG